MWGRLARSTVSARDCSEPYTAMLRIVRSITCTHHLRTMSQMSTSRANSVLGLKMGATTDEIKERYFTLAKKTHPDTNNDSNAHADFITLGNALDTLLRRSNPVNVPEEMREAEASNNRAQWYYEHISKELNRESHLELREATQDQSSGGPDWGGWWQMADMMAQQQLETEQEQARLQQGKKGRRKKKH